MTASPVEPTPTPTEPTVATPAPVPTAPTEATPTDNEGWQSLVGKLREDIKAAKADRTPQDEKDAKTIAHLKRQLESTQSPEDVKNELAQTIGKALGLVKDEPIDPAKLTESLTTAQTEAKQARVELAVFRNAMAAGGDPAALLDSTSFLKSLDGVDPNDGEAVKAAIAKAVETNARLGAATPSGPITPAPNPAQGAGAGGAPGLDAQIADATKAGNIQLAIALKQERAASLAQK